MTLETLSLCMRSCARASALFDMSPSNTTLVSLVELGISSSTHCDQPATPTNLTRFVRAIKTLLRDKGMSAGAERNALIADTH